MQKLALSTRAGDIVLDARKAAYLPDHDTLLLADLHFEKGSYLQARGHAPLPTYDTQDTLARLSGLIADYAPKTVIALGDSFHDIDSGQRLSEANLTALNACAARADFIWILGNHDPDIPPRVVGAREDHVQLGGYLLTHHPTDVGEGEMNICGHMHPKLRVKLRQGRASGPCFAISEIRMIMPSFGSFTGGLWVDDPAMIAAIPAAQSYGLIQRGRLYHIKA